MSKEEGFDGVTAAHRCTPSSLPDKEREKP